MNPIIISTIIGSAALVFSVFGASWLNQRAMMQSQQDYREFTKALMAELDKRLEAKFEALNYRFDAIDVRLTNIEQRLDRLEAAIFKPIGPR